MLDAKIDKHPKLSMYAQFKEALILFSANGYTVTSTFRLTKHEVQKASEEVKHPFTIPDRLFIRGEQISAVYVDGPTHLTPNGSKKDAEINQQLAERNIRVLRLPYTTTKKGIISQLSAVEQFVLGLGKMRQ